MPYSDDIDILLSDRTGQRCTWCPIAVWIGVVGLWV
jgi:hypothetical protein